jgi:uncharacterized RDD family membrane protein YckC/DNA-binding transcriptional ArsR family regulator
MSLNDENVSKVLLILSHKIRRNILLLLLEKEELSFSELMNILKIDTGKMSFHLRNLKLFLDQTSTGKYQLNKFGQRALRILKDIEALSIDVDFLETKSSTYVAKFSKRVAAFALDMGVTFTILITVTLIAEVFVLFTGQFLFHQNFFVFLVLLWLYSTLLEGYGGQTIGKYLVMIKTVSITSKKLDYDAAAVRNFGKCFLLPVDLLIGRRLDDTRFIRYFDKYAGTTVIRM